MSKHTVTAPWATPFRPIRATFTRLIANEACAFASEPMVQRASRQNATVSLLNPIISREGWRISLVGEAPASVHDLLIARTGDRQVEPAWIGNE